MQTILAIDIQKGKVVKAFAGFRMNYKPLKINSIDFSDPIKFINYIKKNTQLDKIYLADLDSINNLFPNTKIIEKLLIKYPNLKFFIDGGFDYPASINKYYSNLEKKKLSNFKLILGTEKLKNFYLNSFFLKKNIIISIDFNGDESKWINKIKDLKRKPELIFMFLKNVGGRGINWKKISYLSRKFESNKFNYAGGVKYLNHIKKLKCMGFSGVIISSLIHQYASRDSLTSLEFNF